MNREKDRLARSNILLVVERPVQSQILNPSAIAVEGFAVAPAGIVEIVVKLGGIIQPATYGLYRNDLASAFPNHPPLARSGFACEVDCSKPSNFSKAESNEAQLICVTARDRTGREQTVYSKFKLGLSHA